MYRRVMPQQPMASTLSLMVSEARDVNTDPGYYRATDLDMSCQLKPLSGILQPRPWASTWALAAIYTLARNINPDPRCLRTTDPNMMFGSSQGQDVTMATGGCIGYPEQHGPHASTPHNTNVTPSGSPDTGPFLALSSDMSHTNHHRSPQLLQNL